LQGKEIPPSDSFNASEYSERYHLDYNAARRQLGRLMRSGSIACVGRFIDPMGKISQRFTVVRK
jgi:hypothetical protein